MEKEETSLRQHYLEQVRRVSNAPAPDSQPFAAPTQPDGSPQSAECKHVAPLSTDPDTLKLNLVKSASHNDNLDFLSDKLERENPGKTIVLNAATREVIIASDRSDEIAEKLKTLGSNVITLFIGGPHKEALAFHGLCPSK